MTNDNSSAFDDFVNGDEFTQRLEGLPDLNNQSGNGLPINCETVHPMVIAIMAAMPKDLPTTPLIIQMASCVSNSLLDMELDELVEIDDAGVPTWTKTDSTDADNREFAVKPDEIRDLIMRSIVLGIYFYSIIGKRYGEI